MAAGLRATIIAGSALLQAMPAHAGGLTSTANGDAQAQVVAPLIVTRESDLEFGAVFAGGNAGTITVSPAGGTTFAGGAQPACVAEACFEARPAQFAVRGEAGRSYVVAVPLRITATGTITDGSGRAAMPLSVTAIEVRSASRPAEGPGGQLNLNGQDRFEVGGTLELPANLPSASYRATIPVIVTYS